MTARDKREIIGGGLTVVGIILAVVGASRSASKYGHLSAYQATVATASELLAPDLTLAGIGVLLIVAGLVIFFASSNKRH